MTDKSSAKRDLKAKPGASNRAVQAPRRDDETEEQAVARIMLAPDVRHGQTNWNLLTPKANQAEAKIGVADCADAIQETADRAQAGDLAFASRMLAAQANTLDTIFTEMARRSALNMGDYLDASERYMRLALKAQANSRATLEALAKLHQPREQTVRHVHVNEGGQAVIADQFHHHGGGQQIGQSGEQPHATGAAGASPALPSPDPIGPALPVASGEGTTPLPNARRQGQRRA